MTNQYINHINKSTKEEQLEQPKGLNKTGILLLKNIIDKIEYCLYNNKLPYPMCVENIDLNEVFNQYLYSSIKQTIHISITSDSKSMFKGTGRLKGNFENKIEKFYLVEVNNHTDANYFNLIFSYLGERDGIEYIVTDLELLLFDLVDLKINIKINTIRNEESDEVEEGNTENETKCTN